MPDRKPTSRARVPDRKRQLVDCAATLFIQRGYAQVSLADIARAAGVTAPSVYRHFDDKRALLAAAVLAGVDDLEACTDRALANPTRPTDELIEAVCALGVARPGAETLWRWSTTYLSDEQNLQVVQRTHEVIRRWAAALVQGNADLTERESLQLAWATTSVSGSTSVHRTRMSSTRARAELAKLIHRLIALRPSTAPPLSPATLLPDLTGTRRDQILDAAAALFADRGYAAVGVDQIGAAVGITGPSVYKHFPSKIAILVGIGQRSAMRLEAAAMSAFGATSDPSKRLALLVDSYVTFITTSPDLSVSFNSAGVLAGQPAAVELLDLQRRYVARWIDLLTSVDPELRHDQGAFAVHAALTIVNDAIRVRRGKQGPHFAARMAYLMKGVLDV